ncbi:TniB family NTP-binding protein [Microbacterium trichothecenolyticum]|uniref:TniB family NTP-binding protein n=1 Tax=Microbacterium trichothecenolyticum TaxID=69370 RepID=UPI0035BE41B0
MDRAQINRHVYPVLIMRQRVRPTSPSRRRADVGYSSNPVTRTMTLEERTQLVLRHLREGRTSLVVIDEMQNLAAVTRSNFESAQAIKNLMNGVHAVPMYVGINLERTSVTEGDLGLQFAARSTLVKLGGLGYETAADRSLWKGSSAPSRSRSTSSRTLRRRSCRTRNSSGDGLEAPSAPCPDS